MARGWASVIVDIPGTAGMIALPSAKHIALLVVLTMELLDGPAARNDPTSPDRVWTSILDWMASHGSFNMSKVIAWGLSAGGHNAIRVAHTHASRLAGSVGQGAGTHHFFSRAWLEKAKDHEYPWTLLPAMREKLGYETEEAMLDNAQKDFSLVETGIVEKPSCRLLLINGTHDGLMPIEDSMLMMEYGSPKEARFFTGLLHMGYPPANGAVSRSHPACFETYADLLPKGVPVDGTSYGDCGREVGQVIWFAAVRGLVRTTGLISSEACTSTLRSLLSWAPSRAYVEHTDCTVSSRVLQDTELTIKILRCPDASI